MIEAKADKYRACLLGSKAKIYVTGFMEQLHGLDPFGFQWLIFIISISNYF